MLAMPANILNLKKTVSCLLVFLVLSLSISAAIEQPQASSGLSSALARALVEGKAATAAEAIAVAVQLRGGADATLEVGAGLAHEDRGKSPNLTIDHWG